MVSRNTYVYFYRTIFRLAQFLPLKFSFCSLVNMVGGIVAAGISQSASQYNCFIWLIQHLFFKSMACRFYDRSFNSFYCNKSRAGRQRVLPIKSDVQRPCGRWLLWFRERNFEWGQWSGEEKSMKRSASTPALSPNISYRLSLLVCLTVKELVIVEDECM